MELSTQQLPSKAGRRTLLLVEDHDGYRQVLKRMLESYLPGWLVCEAGSVAEAKRKLDEGPADVLVCDMTLPDGLATDVLDNCPAALNGRTKAIVFSNHSTEDLKQVLRHPGVHGQIAKERGPRELVRMIEELAYNEQMDSCSE